MNEIDFEVFGELNPGKYAINPETREILYVDPSLEGILGKKGEAILIDPDVLEELTKYSKAAGQIKDVIIPYTDFNGNEREITGAVMFVDGILYGTAYNHTEERQRRRELEQRLDEAYRDATTDPLTGLKNRRYVKERLSEEIKRAERGDYPITVAMLDLADFKKINDEFGHQAGDEALRAFAEILKESVRGYDLLTRTDLGNRTAVRYGGDEFLLVLPETSAGEVGKLIIERLREKVEKYNSESGKPYSLDFDIGFATRWPKGEPENSLEEDIEYMNKIIAEADERMYENKRNKKQNR